MESPPSFSTLSEAPPLSEDSGLLITSGSFSSDSASGWHQVASELQESDFDDRSLSLCESADTSERMCGDFFNTVKKGPFKVVTTTIEPPPEFQDYPVIAEKNSAHQPVYTGQYKLLSLEVPADSKSPIHSKNLKPESIYERRQCLNHRFTSPRLLHLSPCRGTRPSSRNSLSSRLSSSHNSLVTQFLTDDSTFITQAISHDTLSAKTSDITDMYNVPFDSDIYAVPVDVVRPSQNMKSKGKKSQRNIKRGKSSVLSTSGTHLPLERHSKLMDTAKSKDTKSKRHSLPGSSSKKSSTDSDNESVHLTLREMRKYLHTLYSNSSESDYHSTVGNRNNSLISNVGIHSRHPTGHITNTNNTASTAVFLTESREVSTVETNNNNHKKHKNTLGVIAKSKKHKENNIKEIRELERNDKSVRKSPTGQNQKSKMSPMRILSLNLKESFCNLFRWRRAGNSGVVVAGGEAAGAIQRADSPSGAVRRRALPPLPNTPRARHTRSHAHDDDSPTDFATSIQKVKDYGWYWGPLSVEAAEKILSNEPDGSFIVRDSSDDHYIFTLTFKLNGLRHVRIEHDQGNFCFGGCTMFKASTIVEFIENAVETSRSGRYLFFLNLRPVLGPVRVQLLYPVSRFKRVQSLQHMCRFVILKNVRRDLIKELPLPRRLLDYLSTTHYYAELLSDI